MALFEDWKKEMEEKLKNMPADEKDKIAAVVSRCPKCHKTTLEFDPKTGRFYCSSCGFEVIIERMR